MRFSRALQAAGLATVVAFGGIAFQPTFVTATDPAPTASPDPSATPVASPSPVPASSPDASAAPDPSASAAPTATPDPSTTPDPTAPAPTPAPTTAPVTTTTPTTTTTTASRPRLTVRQRIVRIALAQRWDRYVPGAIGPNAFDCSGLVRYVYNRAGVGRRLGGGHSARMMYLWGRAHHLTSPRHPRIGDVAVWGRGSHVGIYIGNGRVISALNTRLDVRITRVHALNDAFTTFIHTRLP